jgi:hypothetical protein
MDGYFLLEPCSWRNRAEVVDGTIFSLLRSLLHGCGREREVDTIFYVLHERKAVSAIIHDMAAKL